MSAVISVKSLGKRYKCYPHRWARLAEWLSCGKFQGHQGKWILRDINFEINQGDSVGIIGVNGAGKSTLLKLLTQTSFPTEGNITVRGRVAALLELGMGFHMDFTGKVNALMTCQMMGLSSQEAQALIEDIREFSELGDYLDQPVRIYSSGMQVRLAFSAATAIRPDILIVDEALSVGDAYFQHKCINRIREFRDAGTTLLFVSHDAGVVKTLCGRAILLDGGGVIKDGTPEKVLDYYNSVIARKSIEHEITQVEDEKGRVSTRSGNGKARINTVELTNEEKKPVRTILVGEKVVFSCNVSFFEDMETPTVGILIRDRLGNDVFGTNTSLLGYTKLQVQKGERFDVAFTLDVQLGAGNYSVCLAIHSGESHLEDNCDWWDRCMVFQVIPNDGPGFVGVAALPVKVDINR